jgi:glycosyltransferase involved in cell wall biosynthesis
MRFQFITAIPLNVWKGSGCFVGITIVAKGIRALGGEVNFVTPAELASEYNGPDVFCLPSVQEGFGIVFLKAMAAAVPEVVRHGQLVEPESVDALAVAIQKLHDHSLLRTSLAEQGRRDVEYFEMRPVARQFVEMASGEVRESAKIREMEIAR